MNDLRQVVLDTETTGLSPDNDRIVEIGCVELVNRRLTYTNYHQYINPQMAMPQGAYDVHGLGDEFLADKPLFADVFESFLDYVKGSQLIIHNAGFDIGFLNAELRRLDPKLGKMSDYCEVIDSLATARELHPGQRNDLDSLARRYTIDNSHRTLHGALLDSEILAEVYLLMTGGQSALSLDEDMSKSASEDSRVHIDISGLQLTVIKADAAELAAHQEMLIEIEKNSGAASLWSKLNTIKSNDVDASISSNEGENRG